jgi:hypothetical protein
VKIYLSGAWLSRHCGPDRTRLYRCECGVTLLELPRTEVVVVESGPPPDRTFADWPPLRVWPSLLHRLLFEKAEEI